MKLTPLEIRKQEFSRTFRGYDADEVTAFLQLVAGEWDELANEFRRLESRLSEYETKLRHYEQIEVALQQALKSAQESSEQLVEGARAKAEGLVREAEAQAVTIKREAEEERRRMRDDVMHLKSRRDQTLARLRAFLQSERELLEQYESDEAIRFGSGRMEQGQPTPRSFYQPRPGYENRFSQALRYGPNDDPDDDLNGPSPEIFLPGAEADTPDAFQEQQTASIFEPIGGSRNLQDQADDDLWATDFGSEAEVPAEEAPPAPDTEHRSSGWKIRSIISEENDEDKPEP